MGLRLTQWLAYAFGVIVPIGELVRRRDQLSDAHVVPLWMDDVLLGAFLLAGAWAVGRDAARGRAVLAAALGVACGMGMFSLSIELSEVGFAGSAGVGSIRVALIKALLLVLAACGLIATLRADPERTNP